MNVLLLGGVGKMCTPATNDIVRRGMFSKVTLADINSDIKPPPLVVDPKRFYRPGEKTAKPCKIRNTNIEIRNKSEIQMFKCLKHGKAGE